LSAKRVAIKTEIADKSGDAALVMRLS